ncbi:MAG: hypothetical protein RL490_1875 [Pseudomonadota bacterium]
MAFPMAQDAGGRKKFAGGGGVARVTTGVTPTPLGWRRVALPAGGREGQFNA